MQIYQILNNVNGKSYIGKSVEYKQRFRNHIKNAKKKVNRRLYDSMNYHGYDNFTLILIEDLGEASNDIINDRERYWIKYYDTMIPNGYNMTLGGDGGNTLAYWDEDRKKTLYVSQGDKRKGKRPKEWCKAISEGAKEREKNKTYAKKKLISEKISKTLKDKYSSGEIESKPPIFYGEDHPLYINVDLDVVLKMIQECKTLKQISEELNVSRHGIRSRLKEKTNKNFLEWRREYGIVGRLSKPRRNS